MKEISTIEGLEDFSGYFVDINGNIYSNKQKNRGLRKMGTYWSGTRTQYKKVMLCGKSGIKRCLNVHIIVAKAFIPKHLRKRYIVHKTENRADNSIHNITTIEKKVFRDGHKAGGVRKDGGEKRSKPGRRKKVIQEAEKEFLVSDNIIEKLKILYTAAQIKGLSISNEFDFINSILDQLIDDYSNQKGLKRIIHQILNNNS